jgi:hypothetical protein
MNRRGVIAACLLAALTAAGCGRAGSGPERHQVSGTVSFAGRPVPRGRIEFEPDAARGNRGPVGVARIVDGRYQTERRFGAVPGPQTVRISGSDGVTRSLPGEGWTDPDGTPLFTDHVEAIDLPAGVATVDFAVPAR